MGLGSKPLVNIKLLSYFYHALQQELESSSPLESRSQYG